MDPEMYEVLHQEIHDDHTKGQRKNELINLFQKIRPYKRT